MNNNDQLLVFSLDDRRYSVHLEAVERVLRALEVTPLPDAPEIVLGIINVHGRIIPVINLRRRFCLPDKEIYPGDRFIIASASGRTFALAADAVHGVVECPGQSVVPAAQILPQLESVAGVAVLADGMVLISDIDKLLSLGEGATLGERLPGFRDQGPENDEQ